MTEETPQLQNAPDGQPEAPNGHAFIPNLDKTIILETLRVLVALAEADAMPPDPQDGTAESPKSILVTEAVLRAAKALGELATIHGCVLAGVRFRVNADFAKGLYGYDKVEIARSRSPSESRVIIPGPGFRPGA